MNENWSEIVEDLSPYLKPEPVKGDYLRDIGYCLRYLGWKKTNGTMVFRDMRLSSGDDSGQPDILICKKDKDGTPLPVLPVVIELPDREPSGRLALSMRRLKLDIGLYIGKNIRLYYQAPGYENEPACVFTANFQKDDMNGNAICDLLLYDSFSPDKMDGFVMDAIHGLYYR